MGKGGEKPESTKGRKITLEELSAHRTPEDGKSEIGAACPLCANVIAILMHIIYLSPPIAWLSYQGKVYDVSNWADHPGNATVLPNCEYPIGHF